MPRNVWKFTGSKEMARWAAGLKAAHVSPAMVTTWAAATDLMFDKTQAVVHVISGDLKASGRSEVEAKGSEIEGRVSYGDGQAVDYAIYELARGGQHDFYERGYAEAAAAFESALGASLEIMMAEATGAD